MKNKALDTLLFELGCARDSVLTAREKLNVSLADMRRSFANPDGPSWSHSISENWKVHRAVVAERSANVAALERILAALHSESPVDNPPQSHWKPIATVPRKCHVILINEATCATVSLALSNMDRIPQLATHWCYPPERREEET